MAAPTTTQEMTLLLSNVKTSFDVNNVPQSETKGGFLYQTKLSLGGSDTSNAILLPQGQLSDIRLLGDKTPAGLYGTLSSKDDIEAGNAIWTAITYSALVQAPLALTALYVVGNASASIVLINVRCIGG